jgi:signal transduction histidine kinase
MKPLAEAACELPWLAPRADSLVALARGAGASSWSALRLDPGLVLLLLRAAGPSGGSSALPFYTALLREPRALSLALDRLGQHPAGFVDWSGSLAPIYRCALTVARTAEVIALHSDRSDPEHAFVAGMLAPLGWLAAAAVNPDATQVVLQALATDKDPAKLQHRLWGLEAAAIARRLAPMWGLPAWLATTAGHLGLPVEVAATLGADPDRFLIVQLAVSLVEQAGLGLRLPVGAAREELTAALDLSATALEGIRVELIRFAQEGASSISWSSPNSQALLPDLLRLALENRRATGMAARTQLHADLDALHSAVVRHNANETGRLRESKLRALAELAAGAGHEINNPLAVISGQAQYLLGSEQEPARCKALQTIVGQAQRIHQVLTGLMHFARPAAPRKQPVDLGGLVREVLDGLQSLADDRQVQLQAPDPLPGLTLLVDPGQMRTALTALLRNAIEASPAAGWARLQVEQTPAGALHFIVEDSGPGPTVHDREHLFDPFYSGRKAGRGRGLGLPTAWQLARQHAGELRLDGEQPTRFLLELPAEAVCPPERNGFHGPAREQHAEKPGTASAPGLGLSAPTGNAIPALG